MAKLAVEQIEKRLAGLPGWKQVEVGGQPGIEKTFKTGNFMSGLKLVTSIAELAEAAGHHPDVLLTYPKVVIQLTTHDAGGLTAKDFDLARDIEKL